MRVRIIFTGIPRQFILSKYACTKFEYIIYTCRKNVTIDILPQSLNANEIKILLIQHMRTS
jgi:hypothetical protein